MGFIHSHTTLPQHSITRSLSLLSFKRVCDARLVKDLTMTNPIQYGAQQLNTYRQQYQQDNNSLKNKDIVYADKNNLDNLDDCLEGFLMGHGSISSAADFNGDGNTWQSSDYASLIGISEELYDDVYTTLYTQDPSTVSAEKVIKHIDGLDCNIDGTISATVKQQEEARVEEKNKEITDRRNYATNQYNIYKDKSLSQLQEIDITYGKSNDISENLNHLFEYSHAFLSNIDKNNEAQVAKTLGISENLYKTILSQMPEGLKEGRYVLYLLDASDKGGLDGSLTAENRKALEEELKYTGKVDTLFPDITYNNTTYREMNKEELVHHIKSCRTNKNHALQKRMDLEDPNHFEQKIGGSVRFISQSLHTGIEVTSNPSAEELLKENGTHIKAGGSDTYESFSQAIFDSPLSEKIYLQEMTPAEKEKFKEKINEALKEYSEKYLNNASGSLKTGNEFHVGTVLYMAFEKMEESPSTASIRKKINVIPGKKRKTTTTTLWSKLWVPLLGYALYEIAQDDDILNFS